MVSAPILSVNHDVYPKLDCCLFESFQPRKPEWYALTPALAMRLAASEGFPLPTAFLNVLIWSLHLVDNRKQHASNGMIHI